MITFGFDHQRLRREVNDMATLTDISLSAAITRTSRLWLRDCIRSTPPTGTGAAATKKAAQRKRGESRIRLDVGYRAFPLLSRLRLASGKDKTAERIGILAAGGRYDVLEKILRSAGIPVERVLDRPDTQIHQGLRVLGRVRKPGNYWVTDAAAQVRYLKTVLDRSGSAKRGWAIPAKHLRLPRPGWGKTKDGGYFRGITDRVRPTIVFGNTVPWLQSSYYQGKIMQTTLRYRESAMKKELEHYFRAMQRGDLARLRARFRNRRDVFEALEE